MNNRFMTILFAGLLTITAVLFVLACGLSRKQYRSSIQSIKADCSEILANESRNVRTRARSVERDAFALFDQTNPPVLWSSTNMLFRMDGASLVPLGLPRMGDAAAPSNGMAADDARVTRLRDAWKAAEEWSQLLTNQAPPFRIPRDGSILSVNAKRQACLLPLEAFRNEDSSNAITHITTTAPGTKAALSRELRYPPVYVWIPTELFDARKQSVQQAYLITNVMLGVLLTVMVCLGFAIGMLVKRQHEMARLRSSFVSSVSHELRTPMALIRLYAESLAADNPPPGTKERYTRAIMAETDRLISLVNNVLDFSRLEKGALVLNVRSTDVSKLCNDVLESFTFRMEKEGLTLARNIAPGLTAFVDPLAMTQVIFNIVDNAIKYAGGASPIEVELLPADQEICFRVKDNGIGIPDSLKPRISLPFVRGEDSRVTAQRGSGIGLSVVTQLLDAMQGSMRFFDNVPRGTVFEVRLPTTGAADSPG